jgi:hypothetical protein
LTRFAPPLLQVGMPGGIIHAQDNLAAGPMNLIIDPTADSNPASASPYGTALTSRIPPPGWTDAERAARRCRDPANSGSLLAHQAPSFVHSLKHMNVFGERYMPVGPVEAPDGELIDAVDTFHARPVALRVRLAAPDGDRDEISGEARALMSLPPHPNVSTVRDAFFAGDKYVIVMDRPEGQTPAALLAALLAAQGDPGLPVSAAFGYLEQLAAALDHLHSQQPPVTHGDVRPESILVTVRNAVLLTPAGMGYRAPAASDIAGFGATAVQLVTGSRPGSALAAAADDPIWDCVDPGAAKHLSRILRRALDQDPARRPISAGVIVERLRAWRAADLPTGAVTFLLTDIEGSTNL